MSRPVKHTVDYFFPTGFVWKRLDWYVGPLQIQVKSDLKERPDISEKLGRFKCKFIDWCSKQRVVYEADIDNEFQEFERKFILARLENIDLALWESTRKRIFERDNYTCKYCKVRGGILEIDHIIPISKCGGNQDENLTTSCRRCNRQKKDKIYA